MKSTDWTPYADVNELLRALLTAVRAILNDQFVGMYLDGSLAAGDFEYETSDIDFVVVTAAELSEEVVEELVAMHGRIGQTQSKWATEIEGAYIPVKALRRYNSANATHPYIDRGDCHLRLEHLEMDWVIHRHVLHNFGVRLAGPPIHTLVDPVSTEELQQAVLDLFNFWWLPMIENPAKLQHDGYRAYAILTMCRMLYTFENGNVVSKPAAARWALETLNARWAKLIEQALTWQADEPMDNLNETREFIRYTAMTLTPTLSLAGRGGSVGIVMR